MAEFFSSARVVDCIIVLMVLEAVVLVVWRRRSGRGMAGLDVIVSLLAGAFLLLALRAALLGSGYLAIAACLSAALVAHLIDLRRRWRSALSPPAETSR